MLVMAQLKEGGGNSHCYGRKVSLTFVFLLPASIKLIRTKKERLKIHSLQPNTCSHIGNSFPPSYN